MRTDPGSLLLHHGHPEQAFPLLIDAWTNDRDNVELLCNVAACTRQLGHFNVAKEFAMRALELNKQFGPGWHNLGMIFEDLGHFTEACEAYEAAFSLMPENQLTAINYAYSLMRLERFDEAWPHWMFGRAMRAWQPLPGIPVWQGEDNLAGKRILVNRDGGYGDGIMFARWLPELERRGAIVTYRVWDKLAPLVEYAEPLQKTLVYRDSVIILPHRFDLQCAAMSLPALLGMKSLEDIPPSIRVRPDPFRRHKFAEMLPEESQIQRVGICFHAEENGVARKHRSIPEAALEPLARVPGIRFFSLCPHGSDLHRHDPFVTPAWMEDLTPEFKDWSDTAAFMANLDLVVTVDTACAHLAGAMGLPTWVLVPHRSDWKFFLNREDSPFYPSVRVFRQADPLSWASLIEQVANELKG